MTDSNRYLLNASSVQPLASGQGATKRQAAPQTPKKARRRIRFRILGLLLLPELIAVAIFCGAQFTSSFRSVEAEPTSAVVTMSGERIALVAFDDHTRPGIGEPMFQMRLAAYRLSDGAQLWDQRINEELSGAVVVLAASDDLIYVAETGGLVILDADGDIIARGDGIDGIGADAVLAVNAYAYDAGSDAIVLLSTRGDILQIPVGSTSAQPATPAQIRAGQGLSAETRFDDTVLRAGGVEQAIGPDGTTFSVRSVDAAVGRDALEIGAESGTARAELVDAELLPVLPADQETPAAAGAGQGFVLVQHRESVNSDALMVSSIDVATGSIVDSAAVGGDLDGALPAPDGTTVYFAGEEGDWYPNRLMVLADDGSIDEIRIGQLPWWMALFG